MRQGADMDMVHGTGRAAIGEHGTWCRASSGRRMYGRLVPLSSWQRACCESASRSCCPEETAELASNSTAGRLDDETFATTPPPIVRSRRFHLRVDQTADQGWTRLEDNNLMLSYRFVPYWHPSDALTQVKSCSQ
eukprot:scaffold4169_cov57-Phaeocystis_antarctica.AAC.2